MPSSKKKTQDTLRGIPSWAMELWIAAILIVFVVIRVLGSETGQRLLHHFGLRHS
jgi:hypothetical protein